MDLSLLPAVNAALNSIAIVLLSLGLWFIRQGRIRAHRNTMISAFGGSALFLVFYVLHKWWKTAEGLDLHTVYRGEGLDKGFYLLMLFTHLVLAMLVPFIAITLIWLGLTRRYGAHRRLARVGWPIWMYVSVTGVGIYLMLYWFNPAA